MDVSGHVVTLLLILSVAVNLFQAALTRGRRLTDLEAKVRFLLDRSGADYDPVSAITPALRDAVAAGRTIAAIKLYRDVTGASLRQAKQAVERIAS